MHVQRRVNHARALRTNILSLCTLHDYGYPAAYVRTYLVRGRLQDVESRVGHDKLIDE